MKRIVPAVVASTHCPSTWKAEIEHLSTENSLGYIELSCLYLKGKSRIDSGAINCNFFKRGHEVKRERS